MRSILSALLLLCCITAAAQRADSAKLKIFIDCRTGCDMQYTKSEIRFVDFVTNRLAADAHVLITRQTIGNGGSQYQINFYGQNRFRRYKDTLRFETKPTATADEVRQKMVQYILMGLTPLLAKTTIADALVITLNDVQEVRQQHRRSFTHDRWDYWVFRVGARGELSADKVYNSNLLNGYLSANRTTDKLKLELYVSGSRRHSLYTIDDGGTMSKYAVKNSDYGVFSDVVKSFGPHWSYGFQLDFSNNTFNNIKKKIYFNPAVEYNIFNYKEVNNRFFALRYGIDVNDNFYYDTTIYDKMHEVLYGHRFSAALTLNKKWGTFFSGINYRNYFNDWKLNSMGITVNADVRITGGLSFFVSANGSLVHNQVSLVKGDATEQEVLTRQRQLASTYNYYTSFGLNYRFGSILNNFVNPRFEGYGGF
jgi:hypothetical protein